MKHFKNLILLTLILGLASCSKEASHEIEENSKTIEVIISEIEGIGNEANKIVEFDVSTTDGISFDYNVTDLIDSSNQSWDYGFTAGFLQKSTSVSFEEMATSIEGGGIKVSCEKTGAITVCPKLTGFGARLRQAKCVGKAVESCLNSGGCAEVCKTTALVYYYPELDLFQLTDIETEPLPPALQ